MYSLNINGLLSHIDELRVSIDDHRPDIICINRTQIDDKIHVAIYVLKELEFAAGDDLMTYNLENVTIQLKIENYRSFIVTAFYRPPDKPVEYFD